MAFIQLTIDPEHEKAAAAGGGATLPAGWYIWQVQSFEHQAPKENGKYATTVMKCEIRSSFNQSNLGRKITVRFNHNPSSIPYNLMRFLKAAGIPFQSPGNGSIAFDDSLLNGVIIKATCKLSPRDAGGYFENWEDFEPSGGQAAGPVFAPQSAPAFQPPMQPMQPQQPVQQQAWGPPAPQQQDPQQPMQPYPAQPMQQPQPMQPPQTQWGAPQPQQPYAPPMAQPMPQNGQQPNGGAPPGWPPPQQQYPAPTGR